MYQPRAPAVFRVDPDLMTEAVGDCAPKLGPGDQYQRRGCAEEWAEPRRVDTPNLLDVKKPVRRREQWLAVKPVGLLDGGLPGVNFCVVAVTVTQRALSDNRIKGWIPAYGHRALGAPRLRVGAPVRPLKLARGHRRGVGVHWPRSGVGHQARVTQGIRARARL